MPGVTKHIYEHEIRDIISMWNTQLKSIQGLLPKDYIDKDVVAMLKRFYPHEWYSVEMKYWYYRKKDKYLKKHFSRTRYNMKEPEKLLCSSNKYREIMSVDRRKAYATNYSEEEGASCYLNRGMSYQTGTASLKYRALCTGSMRQMPSFSQM